MLDHTTDKLELVGVKEKQLFKITNRPGGYYFIKNNKIYAAMESNPEIHGPSILDVDDLLSAVNRGRIEKTNKRVW